MILSTTHHEEIHPTMTGLQVYLRLLAELKLYWGLFILSILGLMLFSSMEIMFVDVFGYTINVITELSGGDGGAGDGGLCGGASGGSDRGSFPRTASRWILSKRTIDAECDLGDRAGAVGHQGASTGDAGA